MTPLPVRKVSKIAVLRPSALGDFVFCLPALHALRSSYPSARIVYLGRQWHADYLARRPGPVDRVVVVPPVAGMGSADESTAPSAQAEQFIDAMQRERFDLALQMYGGGRYANPLLRQFRARLSVGLRSADAAPLDRCLPYKNLVNRRLQLLELAAMAGAQPPALTTLLRATPHDRQQAAAAIGTPPARPMVLLQPGASDPRRRWPRERFAALADALAGEGAMIVVNGTDEESALVRDVVTATRHGAIDLSGKLSLSALTGLLAQCSLVVSNDTGPLHLALAMGVPCVGIYWFSNLIESAPLTERGHCAAVALRVDCPLCGLPNLLQRCEHDVSFVDDVTLDEVTALAMTLYRERLA